jgi:hypothetical protein
VNHQEDSEQIALIHLATLCVIDGKRISDYLFAIPNGGKRSKTEAARMKKMGVKPGVSDLLLPIPRKGFHGLWIELKAKKGKPTKEQLEWLDKMTAEGYAAVLCYGCLSAIKTIEQYMRQP